MNLSRNRQAFVYMALGVMIWSLAPLSLDILLVSSDNPFVISLMWKGCVSIGLVILLLLRYHDVLGNRANWSILWDHARSWTFLAAGFCNLDILFFAWSMRLIDVSVATILFGIWPIILIVITIALFHQSRRYRETSTSIVLPLTAAFAGLIFLVMSQVGDSDQHPLLLAAGIFLAALSAICRGGSGALNLRWGTELRVLLEHRGAAAGWDRDDLELLGAVFGTAMSVVPLLPLLALIGFTVGGGHATETLWGAALAGSLIGVPAAILFRRANLLTGNLGINSLGYATPLFAVLWLFLLSRVDVARPDYLIVGTVAIIAANLMINFQAEIRLGFRSLIIAIWTCGTFVYFRGDLSEYFDLRDFVWSSGEYFTAVALAATVFTLILSFRVARITTRMADETNRAFALFSRIDLLASRRAIPGDVRDDLMRIDAHENAAELADAYHHARRTIRRAYGEATDDADRRELAEAAAELDALAHSRQEGQDFGEYVALVVFGTITVALVLFSLGGGTSGWNGFLIEMFTILFSSVIIFLVVNVWDLQRERGSAVLRPDEDGYGVVFRDTEVRGFEQVVSIVVVLAMTAAYGWLLWGKWLE